MMLIIIIYTITISKKRENYLSTNGMQDDIILKNKKVLTNGGE